MHSPIRFAALPLFLGSKMLHSIPFSIGTIRTMGRWTLQKRPKKTKKWRRAADAHGAPKPMKRVHVVVFGCFTSHGCGKKRTTTHWLNRVHSPMFRVAGLYHLKIDAAWVDAFWPVKTRQWAQLVTAAVTRKRRCHHQCVNLFTLFHYV